MMHLHTVRVGFPIRVTRLLHTHCVCIHLCVCIRVCTWQRCDEVPLQHGFEVGVDVAVLVVTHAGDQVLHKLHLVRLRPLVKQDDAVLLVLVIVALRRPFAGARHRTVTDLGLGWGEEGRRVRLAPGVMEWNHLVTIH